MRRALLLKELRSLRPFLYIILALLLLDTVDALLSPLGARSFMERLASLSDELAMLQIVLGFALGSTLLTREIDDGTLNFLDGLPMTRRAIFAAKIEAAMLVLSLLPAGLLLLNAALHAATRGSLDSDLRPALLLTFFGLVLLVTAVGLSAGLLLGFLRTLAWLVLVLCAVGIKLLEDVAPSWAALLNTADLLTLRFTGTAWQLPLAAIRFQLGAVLLFGAAAWALFVSAGSVRARVQRFGKWRRWLLTPAVVLMAAAALGGVVMLIERAKDGRDGGADGNNGAGAGAGKANALAFTPIAAGHATTRHYSFSYPALSSARVAPLIADADRIFEAVAALLGAPAGAPIDVDLSGSTDNHAGTAYLDRIRMKGSDADAGATLAHETSHVLAGRLAGGERGRQLEGMVVLNEGLAVWVEGKLKNKTGVDDAQEFSAAIVSARRMLTPRLLTDHAAFAAAVDDNLKYPLGAVLVDRLVERYGPAAPKTLLHTLASADFPRDLNSYALWQTAFQLAGFDLDLVLDDYARHLKQLERRFAARIAALPRARGSLALSAGADDGEDGGDDDEVLGVLLRFDLPVPKGALPLVRFRPGASVDSTRYRMRLGDFSKGGAYTVQVPAAMIIRGEVCFQPGVMYGALIVYEPWVCLPAAAAGAP